MKMEKDQENIDNYKSIYNKTYQVKTLLFKRKEAP